MMAAIEFVSGPMCERVGWTLLHFVWQGAAVAALASLAVGILRLAHGRGRYAVYLTALGGMALCPAVTFFALPAAAAPAREVVAGQPSSPAVYGAGASTSEATQARSGTAVVAALAAAKDDPPAGPGWRETIGGRLQSALPWIVGGWLVGVFALSVRLALGVAGSWRWRHDLVPLPEFLGRRVAALASRLALARTARVFVSSRAVQAIAVGWLRPMVLVPASFLSQMPPEVLEGVIAHELAHILRRDLWVNLFQRVVETLLFYHPAVWWLSARLRYERELCCDALAVRATGHQVAYAQALEWAGRAAVPAGRASLAAGFVRGRKALLGRVRHVLGLTPAPEYAHEGLAGLAGAAAVILALVGVGAWPVLAGGTESSSVYETAPQWPEFKAKKVSLKEAHLDALSASELIKRLAAAQSIMDHSIVKTKTHTTFWNDYAHPASDNAISPWPGPLRDYSGRMDSDVEVEVRLDGRRCAVREGYWGNTGDPIQRRQPWKAGLPRQWGRDWLWDGTRSYYYSYVESNPRRWVNIRDGDTFSDGCMCYLEVEGQVRGHYESAADVGGDGGVDSFLPAARSLKVRPELEEVGGSPCYVLDADTRYGRYVVWIDPAHGYNSARVEETKRKGDLYGQLRLPWQWTQEKSAYETVRFEQVNGAWVPMEFEIRSETSTPGPSKSLTIHKRTEVILNPDFDALGSFLPDDVEDGAMARLHTAPNGPFGDKEVLGIWKNGSVVPSAAFAPPKRMAGPGDLMPDFTVTTLDGKKWRLSDHRGKVVLLHFTAGADFPIYAVGLTGLTKWYDSMEDYQDQLVMISLSISNADEYIRRTAKEYGLTWPQAQTRASDHPVAIDTNGVLGIPAFIFVGPDGRIIASDETSVMTILKALKAHGARKAPSPGSPGPADSGGLVKGKGSDTK